MIRNSEILPVVRVKVPTNPDLGFVEINAVDFDPAIHQLYEPVSEMAQHSGGTERKTKRKMK